MSENSYKINSLIGKSRIGGVYVADDSKLDRKVALRRFFDLDNRIDFTGHKEEFLEVAHSLINLQHVNLVRVLDAGEDEDGVFLVSELLEGESIYKAIKKGAIEVHEVVELARQILDAFSMAHTQGFYHGALSPRSILMAPRARGGYRYVILDMGLERLAPFIKGDDVRLTMMCDQAILAPELFDGSEPTAQADLYMLGQIVYLCLIAGHPYGGLSIEEAREKHSQGLPPITEYTPDVPQELQDWLSKVTAVNPEDRPASAVEALNLLPQIQHRPAIATPAPMQKSDVVTGNPIKTSPYPVTTEGISKATAPVPITAPNGVQSITASIPIYSPTVNKSTKPVTVTVPTAGLAEETMRVTLKASDISTSDESVLAQPQQASTSVTPVLGAVAIQPQSGELAPEFAKLGKKQSSKAMVIVIGILVGIAALLAFLIYSETKAVFGDDISMSFEVETKSLINEETADGL